MDNATTPTPNTAAPTAADAAGAGVVPPAADLSGAAQPASATTAAPAAATTPQASPPQPAAASGDYAGLTQPSDLPDHIGFSPSEIEQFKEFARSMGYTDEQAQKQLDANIKDRQAFWDNHVAQVDEWRKQAEADPELAGKDGSQWAATEQRVAAVMNKFGNDDVRTLFNVTGLGNHPAMIKLFNAIGQSMSEETLAMTGNAPAAPASQAPQDILYR